MFMTNISSVALLNIQRVHVSAYYRIKIKYKSQSEVITVNDYVYMDISNLIIYLILNKTIL